MNVFIIDDENVYANQIERLITENVSSDVTVDKYCSTSELDGIDWQKYDIAFFDIEIGNDSGIDLAVEAKGKNKRLVVFFVTNHTKYISLALRTLPFQYILKPIDEILFSKELASAKNKVININSTISVRWKGVDTVIPLCDIMYVESIGRKREIVLDNAEVKFSTETINRFEKEISRYGFVKCHASYLVNVRSILKINKNTVLLKKDIVIPVSESRITAVKKAFLNSMSARSI